MRRSVLFVVIGLVVGSIGAGNTFAAGSQTPERAVSELAGRRGDLKATGTDQNRILEEPVVETIKISGDGAGNKRYPGVAENGKGDRLVIFRGQDNKYWFSVCPKGGTWSSPARIPDQFEMEEFTSTDIEVDSQGRFHCLWEQPDKCAAYAAYFNGTWTVPTKLPLPGRYDMGLSIDVRSDDELVVATSHIVNSGGLTKDIFCWFKAKGGTKFSGKNMTFDKEPSAQPSMALDSKDHIWIAYKGENFKTESLDAVLLHFDQDNKHLKTEVLSTKEGWCFWPSVAVNSEDKVMAAWARSQSHDYFSRLFDPAADKMSPIIPVNIGLSVRPWCQFWSKVVSHDKDFYLAVMDPSRVLYLKKFNEEPGAWENFAQISPGSVQYFDLYSGYDKILVAWNNFQEPAGVYLTTVGVEPYSNIRVQPVANLRVEKRIERGFFHGYYLNALTWEANPLNTERSLVITAHRIYRKVRAQSNDQWAAIGEVAGSVMNYEDRNIPADSDYVYAVTCVDDQGNESPILD